MREAKLSQGTVRYRESGSGEPIVFVHGLLVNGLLWRKVVPGLEGEFRCIVPDLPLGAHSPAMKRDADLSPSGLARLIDEFMAELGLDGVTLVGNDTGGALCQIVAANHPERLARLVLTPCDAYENFLPPAFRPLQWIAHVPGALALLLQPLRSDAVARSPLGFGLLTEKPLDHDVIEAWRRPALSDRGVRRDATKVMKGIRKRYTLEAAERLKRFDRPALIAWAPKDRFFKLEFAQRLAADMPNARLELVEHSRTFMPEDQPERLAELIAGFARDGAALGSTR